jgi:ATP-dependent Clp endopeptidase proteolytic subunit ClpP
MDKLELNDEISWWNSSLEKTKQFLKESSGDIEVFLNSPGGEVYEGVSIYNELISYDKGKVHITIGALCASIATYIAMAGDIIKAYDNSTFMIHNVWTVSIGDHRELRNTADIIEGLTSLITNKYAEKTGKTREEIAALMDKESYFFGQEIKDNGFVDEIISTKKEKDKSQNLALAKERFKNMTKILKEKAKELEIEKAKALLKTADNTTNEKESEEAKAKLQVAKMKLNLIEKEMMI